MAQVDLIMARILQGMLLLEPLLSREKEIVRQRISLMNRHPGILIQKNGISRHYVLFVARHGLMSRHFGASKERPREGMPRLEPWTARPGLGEGGVSW